MVLLAVSTLSQLTSAAPPIAAAEAWLRTAHSRLPYVLAPGISAVVVSGKDVHTFGSGVQKAWPGPFTTPADSNTLYEIGSLSKTMVALGLATIVTEGSMSWDDPVRKYLGDAFKLGSQEYVSSTLRVSDLLAHRSGLAEGQGDFLGYVYDTDAYTQRLANVEPYHPLRATFDYSNTGWALAGEVLRRASNASSWCAALHARLLGPLGLNRTYCHRNEIPAAVAYAHLAAVHKGILT